jgi:hypothetical protein
MKNVVRFHEAGGGCGIEKRKKKHTPGAKRIVIVIAQSDGVCCVRAHI